MKYFEDHWHRPFRGYFAACGRVLQQFDECVESRFEDLRFKPGQQLGVAVGFAEQAAVGVAFGAVLGLDHVAGDPDEVVAEDAGPGVMGWVRAEFLECVYDQGCRVGPAPVQGTLPCAGALGDALEGEPPESDLREFGDNGVRDRRLQRGASSPTADGRLGGLALTAGHDISICEPCWPCLG